MRSLTHVPVSRYFRKVCNNFSDFDAMPDACFICLHHLCGKRWTIFNYYRPRRRSAAVVRQGVLKDPLFSQSLMLVKSRLIYGLG